MKPLTVIKKPPTGKSLDFAPKSFRSIKMLDKFNLAIQENSAEPDSDDDLVKKR